MSKRIPTNHPKPPKDFWPTPKEAVEPLLPVLAKGTRFIEPCAGDGALVRHLEEAGHQCAEASDIVPRAPGIANRDGCMIGPGPELLITNPPFAKELLFPLVSRWMAVGRTSWVLLPVDKLINLNWARFAGNTARVLPIGRVRWIAGSKSTSTDNYLWVCLDPSAGYNFLGARR